MRNMHEIFSEIGEEKSIKKKVEILQENDSPGIRAVLRGTFDKRLKWLVPDSVPPYERTEEPDWNECKFKLENAAKSLFYYVSFNGSVPNEARKMNKTQRERLFIEMLEKLHEDEVKIVFAMVQRKLPYKGLTARVTNNAFPDLIPKEFE